MAIKFLLPNKLTYTLNRISVPEFDRLFHCRTIIVHEVASDCHKLTGPLWACWQLVDLLVEGPGVVERETQIADL